MGSNDIVPFTMKPIASQIHLFHFFSGHFAPGGVASAIEAARDGEAFRGRRRRNQLDDGLVVAEGLAPPVR